MNALKDWALTLCLCSIGSGLIYYVTPKGSLEKSLRTIVSIFLLIIIISPLIKIKEIDFEGFAPEPERFAWEIEENAGRISLAAANSLAVLVGASVEALLRDRGYEDFEVEINAAPDGTGRVRAEGISVLFKGPVNRDEVRAIVYGETGIYPEIIEGVN